MIVDEVEDIRALKRVAGHPALDFSNTADRGAGEILIERLHTYTDLLAWCVGDGLLTAAQHAALQHAADQSPTEAATALIAALRLRETIYQIGSTVAAGRMVDTALLADLNAAVRESAAERELVQTETGFDWCWRWSAAAPPLTYPVWLLAHAAAELLIARSDQLRECAGTDCGWLFLDTSRNQSRRWCDMTDCGNRAKARRHYQRSKRPRSG